MIKKSKLIVAVDSGPAHIAVATKTPVVVLFGPGEVNKWHSGWNKNPFKYIYNRIDCSPCREFNCDKNNRMCMDMISSRDVNNTIEEILTPTEYTVGNKNSIHKNYI